MNLYEFLYKTLSGVFGFFFLYLWMLGVVISPTWWEKIISICFFPYALYLIVERNQFF